LTFDSLSYPMFVGVHALVIGLIGASWWLADADRTRATGSTRTPAGSISPEPEPIPRTFQPAGGQA
jgi:hypothetical protein